MTAYVKPGTSPVVGFITDYVSAALTTYTKTLVNTYRQSDSNREMQTLLKLYLVTGVGIVESECGYACSDHAAWTVRLMLSRSSAHFQWYRAQDIHPCCP
jgi:bacterial leucyl aminopeptidase